MNKGTAIALEAAATTASESPAKDRAQSNPKTFECHGDGRDLRYPTRPGEARRATAQTKAGGAGGDDGTGRNSCDRCRRCGPGTNHSQYGESDVERSTRPPTPPEASG